MSREFTPGSETASVVLRGAFGEKTLTAQGDVSFNGARGQYKEVEGAHTDEPKFLIQRRRARFALQTLTDQKLDWVPSVFRAEATITFLSGRIIEMSGVTFVGEGVKENTTQGTTDELAFLGTIVNDSDR